MINVFVLSLMLIITGVALSGMGISSPFILLLVGTGFLGTMRSGAVLIKDKLVEVDEHKTIPEGYQEMKESYQRWSSNLPFKKVIREERKLRYKCEKDYCQEIFE